MAKASITSSALDSRESPGRSSISQELVYIDDKGEHHSLHGGSTGASSWHSLALFVANKRGLQEDEVVTLPYSCPLCGDSMCLVYPDGVMSEDWVTLLSPCNDAAYAQHFTEECSKYKLLLLSGRLFWRTEE